MKVHHKTARNGNKQFYTRSLKIKQMKHTTSFLCNDSNKTYLNRTKPVANIKENISGSSEQFGSAGNVNGLETNDWGMCLLAFRSERHSHASAGFHTDTAGLGPVKIPQVIPPVTGSKERSYLFNLYLNVISDLLYFTSADNHLNS